MFIEIFPEQDLRNVNKQIITIVHHSLEAGCIALNFKWIFFLILERNITAGTKVPDVPTKCSLHSLKTKIIAS